MVRLIGFDFYHWHRKEAVTTAQRTFLMVATFTYLLCSWLKGVWNVCWINPSEWRKEWGVEIHDDSTSITSFLLSLPPSGIIRPMCTQKPILDHFLVGINAGGWLSSSFSEFKLSRFNSVMGNYFCFFKITGSFYLFVLPTGTQGKDTALMYPFWTSSLDLMRLLILDAMA